MKLKIVSYNVKALHYDPQNPRGVADRKEDVAEVIKALDGDIIGLQEIDVGHKRTDFCDQIKYLSQECGYPYFHFTPTLHNGTYGHAIMSRFPIKEVKDQAFLVQFGNNEVRKYCRATLDVEGKELAFYNAHLTTPGCGNRIGLPPSKIFAQYQLMELMQYLYAEELPAILTGDFNLPFDKQQECVDVERVYPLNGGVNFDTPEPPTRIDNIYLCNIEKHSDHVTYGERGASDHPWISANIEI